jgi:hypothetical protein
MGAHGLARHRCWQGVFDLFRHATESALSPAEYEALTLAVGFA